MGKNKKLFYKLFILFIIIFLPIVILFFYSKSHTFIEKNKSLSKEYLNYFSDGYTILYVGYTGCTTVCMPRLNELSNVQRVLNDRGYKNIEYLFLDLREFKKQDSEDFLKAFYGKFNVLFLKENLKKKFLRELEFYFSKSLWNSNEFEHTSYLYLIKKQKDNLQLNGVVMQYPFLNDTTIEFIQKWVKNEPSK